MGRDVARIANSAATKQIAALPNSETQVDLLIADMITTSSYEENVAWGRPSPRELPAKFSRAVVQIIIEKEIGSNVRLAPENAGGVSMETARILIQFEPHKH